ncbi:MAG: hypothetical protein NTW19_09060 [Planctomycetota bacterium]|nr:hypothetical protein [Planctomycetota bacterium]
MAGPDYIVDIEGLRPTDGKPARDAARIPGTSGAPANVGSPGIPGDDKDPSLRGRPWLSVRWRCCGGYTRVYRNAQATAYEGRCPTCSKPVRVKVGQGGTDCRFFEAG